MSENQPAVQLFLVISGPSGVGKDSLIGNLKASGLPIHFIVTYNTRPPRVNEVEGVDYHFITRQQFLAMVDAGEFAEHAKVYDDYKGTTYQSLVEGFHSGKDVILRTDVQGAATIHGQYPEAILIFINAESEEKLIQRLKEREKEDSADLQKRIATIHDELQRTGEFEYEVVNVHGQLEIAAATLKSIIDAEHHRTHPRRMRID